MDCRAMQDKAQCAHGWGRLLICMIAMWFYPIVICY